MAKSGYSIRWQWGLLVTLMGCLSFTAQLPMRLPSQPLADTKPHIILFISDDHGYEDAGFAGAKVVRTPNLDALSKESLRFTHAFCNTPNCVPSRAVISTGLMPARNGAHPNHSKINSGIKTLPIYMQELGYQTILAGKDHVWPQSAYPYIYLKKKDQEYQKIDSILAAHAKPGQKPLFLVVATDNPHVPWPNLEGYDPKTVDIPPFLVDTDITRQVRAKYYTDVTDMDKTVGECLKSMKKYGYVDNTLFIYTTDNGPQWPFGKWNLYDQGIRVPMLVRWPGKVKPGTTDAMTPLVDMLPTLLDAVGGNVPNGLDGRSFLPVLTGKQIAHRDSIYTTYTADTRYGAFNYYPQRSIRTRQLKYIMNLEPSLTYTTHITNAKPEDGKDYWDSWVEKAKTDANTAQRVRAYQQRPAEELYDLEKDPYELRNLAYAPENSATLTAFRRAMETWMESQNDQDGLTRYFFNIKYNRKKNK
ncbi:sulfatase family protein [Spirosoma daeguense]